MLSKHSSDIKKTVKALGKDGEPRAFYFVTDGDRDILHVTGKPTSSSKFKDLGGLNNHYKKYKGEAGYKAFSSSAAFTAGKVSLEGESLVFVPKVKKGVSPGELGKGLKALKMLLKPFSFQVGEEVEQGASSKDAVGASAEALRRYQERVAMAGELAPKLLKQLVAELETELERGDDAVRGPLLYQAKTTLLRRKEESEHRKGKEEQAEALEAMLGEIRGLGANVGGLDMNALGDLRERIKAYLGQGGTEDLSALKDAVGRRRDLLKQGKALRGEFRDLRDGVQAALKRFEPLRAGVPGRDKAQELREILAALETLHGDLSQKRQAVQSLV